MTASTLPDILALIPHRDPLRLVDRVVAVEDDTVVAEGTVPGEGPFAASQTDPPGYLIVEMMAQTVGAWNGWHRLQKGEPPQIGYLLGTRRFRCDRPTLRPGTILRIEARLVLSDGEMASFACIAGEPDGASFAEASLNVYCPAVASKAPV